MRAPKQPSDVASDVTGDTTPTPKGKTDHSRIVAHIDGTPGKPNPNSVTITTATHTGQADAPSGYHPRARHTGTDKRPSGTHPRRSDRESPQAT